MSRSVASEIEAETVGDFQEGMFQSLLFIEPWTH